MKRIYIGVIAGEYCIDPSGTGNLEGRHAKSYQNKGEFLKELEKTLRDRKSTIEVSSRTPEDNLLEIIEWLKEKGLLRRIVDVTRDDTSLKEYLA